MPTILLWPHISSKFPYSRKELAAREAVLFDLHALASRNFPSRNQTTSTGVSPESRLRFTPLPPGKVPASRSAECVADREISELRTDTSARPTAAEYASSHESLSGRIEKLSNRYERLR